jgi:hypothetical protein
MSPLPSKRKETVFQVLNRAIWTQNKAYQSGIELDPRCLRCEAVEIMEHILYGCENDLSISTHTGDYIPNIVLTPLEIVFNKLHPSILLHIRDATTRKVLILLLQEIKCDIVFCHAQLQSPRRREELYPCKQAHLISVINKICSLLEYQGGL